MNYKVKNFLLACSLFSFVACNGSGGGGGGLAINPNVMSGVAATGAPISNGKVEIRGKGASNPVETTTASDGSYSANISALEEPYLVRVISPTGQKYISVASQSALAEGKKINITPISNIIVANVLGNSDVDQVFDNFTTVSDDFTDEKLESEKGLLLQKFVAAGLLGDNGVAGADIDLLNGTLAAGTSDGLDGLLDVLDIEDSSGGGFEIKLKGEDQPFFVDNIGSNDGNVDLNRVNLTAAVAQISVIEAIRVRMNGLAASYSSFANCSKVPVDDGSFCDLDNIYSTLIPYFHPDFKEDGNNSLWGWICESGATTKEQCTEIDFANVQLKDITLIKFNEQTGEALISFNIYFNNKLAQSEEMLLKKDGEIFKLVGNKKSFRYWIQTSSEHYTESLGNGNVDKYQVNLNFWLDQDSDHGLSGGEVFNLEAQSGNLIFPNGGAGQSTMSLYVVKYPQRETAENGSISCSEKKALSITNTPYQRWDTNLNKMVTDQSLTDACGIVTDVCACQGLNFDYETSRLTLTGTQVANMNKFEKISMTRLGVIDEFVIRKPLVINQFNAVEFIPQIGMTAAAFCANTNPLMAMELSTATGQLNYASLYYGLHNSNNSDWRSINFDQDFDKEDDSSAQASFQPVFDSEDAPQGFVIGHRHLYIEAKDEFERSFVRRISCSGPQ